MLAGEGAAGRARSGFAGITAQLEGSADGGEEEGEEVTARTTAASGGETSSASPSSPSALAPPPPLDLSAFDALRLRVRNGDGRPWVVSLRTENWLVGDAGGGGCHDVWQAFLFAPDARKQKMEAEASLRSGANGGGGGSKGLESCRDRSGWTTAELPLSRFLLTHRGRLVEARVSMNAARVVSLGLAPAPLPSPLSQPSSGGQVDGGGEEAPPPSGDFCLWLESISAVSTSRGLLIREEAEEAETREAAGRDGGGKLEAKK